VAALFLGIGAFFLVITIYWYYRNGEFSKFKDVQNKMASKKRVVFSNDSLQLVKTEPQKEVSGNELLFRRSLYAPGLVVLQTKAFENKPYMGYELHQVLLDSGLRFGEMDIFHRYTQLEHGKIMFSLAAATAKGVLIPEEMGAFKCQVLIFFMRLATGKKLMSAFDLMLDSARFLTDELGGEILDEFSCPLNIETIREIRERICDFEDNNPYVVDLLDSI
jgi:Cell division protein